MIELDSAVELVLLLLHLPSDNDGEDEFCVDDDVLDDDELVELFELRMREMPKKKQIFLCVDPVKENEKHSKFE